MENQNAILPKFLWVLLISFLFSVVGHAKCNLNSYTTVGTEVDGSEVRSVMVGSRGAYGKVSLCTIIEETVINLGYYTLPNIDDLDWRFFNIWSIPHPGFFASIALKGVDWELSGRRDGVCHAGMRNNVSRSAVILELQEGDPSVYHFKEKKQPRIVLCGSLIDQLKVAANENVSETEIRGIVGRAITSEIFQYFLPGIDIRVSGKLAEAAICEFSSFNFYKNYCPAWPGLQTAGQ